MLLLSSCVLSYEKHDGICGGYCSCGSDHAQRRPRHIAFAAKSERKTGNPAFTIVPGGIVRRNKGSQYSEEKKYSETECTKAAIELHALVPDKTN